MRVAVQPQSWCAFALDDPGLSGEHGALAEKPAHQRQDDRIDRGLDEHLVFLEQMPAVAGPSPVERGRTIVADLDIVAFLAGADDGVAQPVDEAVAGLHLLRWHHGHAVGLEFDDMFVEIVLLDLDHEFVDVRVGVVAGQAHRSFPRAGIPIGQIARKQASAQMC